MSDTVSSGPTARHERSNICGSASYSSRPRASRPSHLMTPSGAEELAQKCLVLHERDGRLRVIRDVLELLGGEGVVDADRRAAGVDDGEVGDHVLGDVAGHDQA